MYTDSELADMMDNENMDEELTLTLPRRDFRSIAAFLAVALAEISAREIPVGPNVLKMYTKAEQTAILSGVGMLAGYSNIERMKKDGSEVFEKRMDGVMQRGVELSHELMSFVFPAATRAIKVNESILEKSGTGKDN